MSQPLSSARVFSSFEVLCLVKQFRDSGIIIRPQSDRGAIFVTLDTAISTAKSRVSGPREGSVQHCIGIVITAKQAALFGNTSVAAREILHHSFALEREGHQQSRRHNLIRVREQLRQLHLLVDLRRLFEHGHRVDLSILVSPQHDERLKSLPLGNHQQGVATRHSVRPDEYRLPEPRPNSEDYHRQYLVDDSLEWSELPQDCDHSGHVDKASSSHAVAVLVPGHFESSNPEKSQRPENDPFNHGRQAGEQSQGNVDSPPRDAVVVGSDVPYSLLFYRLGTRLQPVDGVSD